MLKALYDYGLQNGLSIPPGFMRKPIRGYILLSANGDYLGIQQCKDENRICPDIGSLANGPDKCNPLAEKAEIVLGSNGKKVDFYRKLLTDGSACIPEFRVCLAALESSELRNVIQEEANAQKIKGMDRITFKVDNQPLPEIAGVKQWWTNYRTQFSNAGSSSQVRCLITGELTTPLETVPTINGLQTVGGHSRGEALICFDKAAFQSYGLKKSANAPVSEEAFSVVKDALNDLLDGSPAMYRREKKRDFNPVAPAFAGLKFVHWYNCSLTPEEDLLLPEFTGFTWEEDEEDSPYGEGETFPQNLSDLRLQADQLIETITSGRSSTSLDCQYHILLISGANGRAMIRRYERGSYETLQKNLEMWKQDMALCNRLGSGPIRPHKLFARLTRLLKHKSADNVMEQMKKELAGVTPAIILAIINGTALPDTVAVRALAYIQSQVYNEKDEPFLPDDIACQWLKAWLSRQGGNRNEEVSKMENFEPNFHNAAYHCGALMAIYADLQRTAMGDVNANVVTRYYASASRTPNLVLGTLERMASVYLDKLTWGLRSIFENRLNQEYAFFNLEEGRNIPTTLNLEQQSYFALGYRQMCTKITHDKLNKKEKGTEED